MTDTKLRCALVYRLDGGDDDSPILLAKYNHASQYETHGGADDSGTTLFGDRQKGYAHAVGMIIGRDPPCGLNDERGGSITIGGFKIVQSDLHQVVYGSDTDGICCAVITGLAYPSRVVIAMLTELHKSFRTKFDIERVCSAKENALSQKAKTLLSDVCTKYQDSSTIDKTQAIQGKVDSVKAQMSDNIASVLKNIETTETLVERSEQLVEQATVFDKNAQDLKRQMKCKHLKVTIILAVIVVAILIVILVAVIRAVKTKNS